MIETINRIQSRGKKCKKLAIGQENSKRKEKCFWTNIIANFNRFSQREGKSCKKFNGGFKSDGFEVRLLMSSVPNVEYVEPNFEPTLAAGLDPGAKHIIAGPVYRIDPNTRRPIFNSERDPPHNIKVPSRRFWYRVGLHNHIQKVDKIVGNLNRVLLEVLNEVGVIFDYTDALCLDVESQMWAELMAANFKVKLKRLKNHQQRMQIKKIANLVAKIVPRNERMLVAYGDGNQNRGRR